MIDVYLIRHAQCEHNLTPEYIWGRTNYSPLTELGIKQSILLGKRLKKEGLYFDEVFSSPAARTMETADITLETMGLNKMMRVDDDLQELDQGEWTGKLRSEMYTPEIKQRLKDEHWLFAAPGGENQEQVGRRMSNWMWNILEKHPNLSKVGVFTHGVAIKCLLQRAIGFTPELIWRFEIENTSITQLRYHPDDRHIRIPIRINDAAHLTLGV